MTMTFSWHVACRLNLFPRPWRFTLDTGASLSVPSVFPRNTPGFREAVGPREKSFRANRDAVASVSAHPVPAMTGIAGVGLRNCDCCGIAALTHGRPEDTQAEAAAGSSR